jgi:hypothetical protein
LHRLPWGAPSDNEEGNALEYFLTNHSAIKKLEEPIPAVAEPRAGRDTAAAAAAATTTFTHNHVVSSAAELGLVEKRALMTEISDWLETQVDLEEDALPEMDSDSLQGLLLAGGAKQEAVFNAWIMAKNKTAKRKRKALALVLRIDW